LKNHAHLALFRFSEKPLSFRGETLVAEMYLAAIGLLQASNQPQCGGLAAATGAQKGEEFPFPNLKVQPVDGNHLIESLGEILNAQETHWFIPANGSLSPTRIEDGGWRMENRDMEIRSSIFDPPSSTFILAFL
jgi:hypothetical protein